jgi:dedicator of cytokinesis protein 3
MPLIFIYSAINLFSCSRQTTKGGRDGGEEIWLENTYFTTEEAFPTVLRRSEVVAMEVLEISPIENALHEVEQKTKELASLNLKYAALAKTTQAVSTNALSMSLNGAVDAPVEGGISSYRQTFLNVDYVTRYPERTELVEKLRKAIDDQVSPLNWSKYTSHDLFSQVRVIDNCLKLHGHLCPPEMVPFHDTLEKFFHKNFNDEIRRLTVDGTLDHQTNQLPGTSQYQPSLYEQSHKRSISTTSTTRPLQVGRQYMTPPPLSPLSTRGAILTSEIPAGSKQTPLQRHLAHLARHGINGVSSSPGPGDIGDTVSISAGSPHDSFVNVVNGVPAAALSNASVANSNLGSAGSLKGRFSRFGSLNFGRRHGNS